MTGTALSKRDAPLNWLFLFKSLLLFRQLCSPISIAVLVYANTSWFLVLLIASHCVNVQYFFKILYNSSPTIYRTFHIWLKWRWNLRLRKSYIIFLYIFIIPYISICVKVCKHKLKLNFLLFYFLINSKLFKHL